MLSKPAAFDQAVAERVEQAERQTKPVKKDTPSGRFYSIDGEDFPSVTHILSVIGKPALISWAANTERTLVSDAAADLYEDLCKLPKPMPRTAYLTTLQSRIGKTKAHQRELAKAGEIGTQVHRVVEWQLRKALGQVVGPEPRLSDDAQWSYMAFEDWSRSVALKPKLIEQQVFSRTHRYAGTMDLGATVDDVYMLIDLKTSKAIYAEAYLQNVAYQVALAEMGHETPAGGLIVRLPKVQTDPAFEVAVVPPVEQLLPTFLAVIELWKWSYANDVAYRERQAQKKEIA